MTDVWSPRDIARAIASGGAFTDQDAIRVARALLGLDLANAAPVVASGPDNDGASSVGDELVTGAATSWRGVYPGMCIDPELCRGRTSCPRDRSCCE